MDKTVLIALLTLVLTPILTSLIQNFILRFNKKDDTILAREGLLQKREEALEKKRSDMMADLEKDLAGKEAECEKLTEANRLLTELIDAAKKTS